VTAEDVIEVLDRLEAAGVRCWVHGGWGKDVLLGQETRSHDDLDLAVVREDLPMLEQVLAEFRRIPERDESPENYVIGDGKGRLIDLHPLRLDDKGNGWQPQRDGTEWCWSREDLSGCGQIRQRPVRCTSAAFEAISHTYEGHDDIDRRDHEELAARFGLPRPTGPWPGYLLPKRLRARDG
jgi:lincosamide nucleotidyltransferase A/C/D/E